MSKDQVWKIFLSTLRKQNIFPELSRLENAQTFFHTFPDSVGTLINVLASVVAVDKP